ncbi:MAG: secretin N-terminal domain-containing protein, partial [Planctomycetota bacterium]
GLLASAIVLSGTSISQGQISEQDSLRRLLSNDQATQVADTGSGEAGQPALDFGTAELANPIRREMVEPIYDENVSASPWSSNAETMTIQATAQFDEQDTPEVSNAVWTPVGESDNSYRSASATFPANNDWRRTSHVLASIDSRMFQDRLVETWGASLQVAESDDGRMARINVPDVGGQMSLLIDHTADVVILESGPEKADRFTELVRNFDAGTPASSISAEHLAPEAFEYVATMLQEEDENGARAEVAVPAASQDLDDQIEQLGLRGEVDISMDPLTRRLIITGQFQEDVDKVQQLLSRILEQQAENQPSAASFTLSNARAEDVVDAIQQGYDQNFGGSRGEAQISANSISNSIIVVGSPDAIEGAGLIVKAFDQPAGETVPGGRQLVAYPLKYISALDAKTRVDILLGRSQIAGVGENDPSAASALTIAEYRGNILLVSGNNSVQQQVRQLLDEIDVSQIENGAVNVVRVFPVRNVLATDLAKVIQDAINGQLPNAARGELIESTQQQAGGQGAGQTQPLEPAELIQPDEFSSQIRSAQLVLETIGGELIANGGIMFDVRISADASSNSLVVRGPEESMDLVGALIEQLDRIPDAETQIKVFQIINGDALTILGLLQQLFTGQDPNTGGGGFGNAQGGNLPPLQTSAASEGASLINMRFSVDQRTNSIIASGSPGDLQVVFDLLTRLDEANIDSRRTFVYRLSNASAADVELALDDWLTEREDNSADDPTYIGNLNQARRDIDVVAEIVSNNLIVTASPEYIPQIERIIRALDRRPPMVKVKVLIVEVNLDALEEFGIDIGVQDSLLYDRGLAQGIGFDFNQAPSVIGNGDVARGSLAAQALSNLGTGRANTTLGYGGLVLSAGNDSVSLLLRALKNKRCARVLSKPHIMTMENLRGAVQIGAQVPRVTGTQAPTGVTGAFNTFSDVPVGIQLEITPRVSPDGMIVMFVDAINSSLGPDATGVTIAPGVIQPQILETSAQTTIMARHGQTVVFSGLIEERKEKFERGAPILSDLPVIGPLFKFEGEEASRREILFILQPFIVNGDEQLDMVNREEMDRMHWCMCDVAEVFGNTNYSPGHFNSTGATQVVYPDLDPTGMNQVVPADVMPSQPMQIDPGMMQLDAPAPAQPQFESPATGVLQLNE